MSDPILIYSDCLDILPGLDADSIDSVVTDPPYGLNFMGKDWDHGVPGKHFWVEIIRVCKPGAFLLAFGGTRTFHRLACAIEDAGWEIRDCVMWLYGGGFPKSNNCLKPSWEPIVVARKKGRLIDLNIDRCRIPYLNDADRNSATPQGKCTSKNSGAIGAEPDVGRTMPRVEFDRPELLGRWPANVIHDGSNEVLSGFPYTKPGTGAVEKASSKDGYGNKGVTFGAESRSAGTPMICYGDEGSASRFFYCAKASRSDRNEGMSDPGPQFRRGVTLRQVENTKTKGNTWPTVKPTELMRYLCRLVTPLGGTILDPFMGSGSTGKAAILEGFDFMGIEKDEEAFQIAEVRVEHAKIL